MSAKQIVRLNRFCQQLNRYLTSMVNFIWLSNETIFIIATPCNSQNDPLYAPVAVSKKYVAADHLLHTRTNVQPVSHGVGWCVSAWTNKTSLC